MGELTLHVEHHQGGNIAKELPNNIHNPGDAVEHIDHRRHFKCGSLRPFLDAAVLRQAFDRFAQAVVAVRRLKQGLNEVVHHRDRGHHHCLHHGLFSGRQALQPFFVVIGCQGLGVSDFDLLVAKLVHFLHHWQQLGAGLAERVDRQCSLACAIFEVAELCGHFLHDRRRVFQVASGIPRIDPKRLQRAPGIAGHVFRARHAFGEFDQALGHRFHAGAGEF